MEKIRIIPKLEIKNNNLIKGIQYEGLRIIGDPKEYAKQYYDDGADQIIVTDIVASLYSRDNLFSTIDKLTNNIFIPITAGGGIKSIEDISQLLNVGADRVLLNSFLFENNSILDLISNTFGAQFLTIMIEAKKIDNQYYCMTNHGRDNTGILVDKWLHYLSKKSFGELAIYSVDNDGLNKGFDENLLEIVKSHKLNVPIIYGGGLNDYANISKAIENYNLSGVSLSSSLHFKKMTIKSIKKYLINKKFRINEF